MLFVDNIANVMILTPDVVRMNADRELKIREFAKSEIGATCNAFIVTDQNGNLTDVELWGGDHIQRAAFKQNLLHEIHQ